MKRAATPPTTSASKDAPDDSDLSDALDPIPRPIKQGTSSATRPAPEAAFVTTQGLDGNAVDSFIDKPLFDTVIARITADSDSISHDKSQRYGRAMSEHFQRTDPAFSVERVACGKNVCLMSINASINDPRQFGDILMTFNGASGLPMYSIVSQTIPGNTPGSAIHRLVFTTDPKLNSISTPVSRR